MNFPVIDARPAAPRQQYRKPQIHGGTLAIAILGLVLGIMSILWSGYQEYRVYPVTRIIREGVQNFQNSMKGIRTKP